jgi:hypothetical protein
MPDKSAPEKFGNPARHLGLGADSCAPIPAKRVPRFPHGKPGEKPGAQQISQFQSVDPVILIPRFEQRISAWSTHCNVRNVRLEQVVQPRRAGSFLQRHLHASAQAMNKRL